jgi:hypothetical protein
MNWLKGEALGPKRSKIVAPGKYVTNELNDAIMAQIVEPIHLYRSLKWMFRNSVITLADGLDGTIFDELA